MVSRDAAVYVATRSTPLVNPLVWKGSFFIPDACPGIPWAPRNGLWTPAYGCYDDRWRAAMRITYRDAGFTHWPYNCAGLPYGTVFPELADDPARVARDLAELRADGLLPIVCATDDRLGGTLARSFVLNAPAITDDFPMWEMNGVLGNNLAAMQALISAVRQVQPQARTYLHFTPGHSGIGGSATEGWDWCQAHGTTGLMAQGGNVISNTDPIVEGRGFETTCVRLAGLVGYNVPGTDDHVPPAWGGCAQVAAMYEWGIWEAFNRGLTAQQMHNYTAAFMTQCPHATGYCSGGFA